LDNATLINVNKQIS